MAVLAQIAGGNVIGRFAHCGHAVMTGEATDGDACMVEARGHPGRGAMAIAADFTCRQMIDGFTAGPCTIVATAAGADDFKVIDPHRGNPGVGSMAGFTALSGEDVNRRLRAGADRTRFRMTAHTLCRCAGKGTVSVAAVTRYLQMGAFEAVTGGEVIETGSWLSLQRDGWQDNQQQSQQMTAIHQFNPLSIWKDSRLWQRAQSLLKRPLCGSSWR